MSVVLVLGGTVVASLGPLVVRHRIDPKRLAEVREVAGHHISVIGTMYAVLLGLIVVDAMSRFQEAAESVEHEAEALAHLVYLADRMPAEKRSEIRRLALDYADAVIRKEWPEMGKGLHLPEARARAWALLRAVRDWEPTTESEKAIYPAGLDSAQQLWDKRRERILVCGTGVPNIFWVVVLIGGFVTIGLTYFLVLEDIRLQVGLTAMVALIVALNLVLLQFYGYPFSGDVMINPDSFRVALEVSDLASLAPAAFL
jgi:hypothetical protein